MSNRERENQLNDLTRTENKSEDMFKPQMPWSVQMTQNVKAAGDA